MGIGVSLAFIAIGAILAFALRVDLAGVDIHLVGWILILVGVISMVFTLAYTRRRAAGLVGGQPAAFGDDAGGSLVQERIVERPVGEAPVERIIERPVEGSAEPVERIIERPVRPEPRGHAGQDPAVAMDPSIAQDPARQNRQS
ncbi:DUF6458 family protein [Actinomadura macrotermitis]|uniref:DUF6458 domain-containing protein n=1 Tax=Actinomadura macrotermitis TaxID=2585200 RepID=A0A7K0BWK9_9ACTN|nr:DUF6458 family protein [Actinomadura macrotermitis]MQY05282.1 hypothetical protein [Actinomadura macrotermitis]